MGKAKTIRSGNLGKHELRLVKMDEHYYGLVDGKKCVDGDVADDVWRRLHDEAGKADPKYFGFDGARARFLKIFPGGFHSESYARDERDYKVAAKSRLEATVPLKEAVEGRGFGEAVLAVFRATNLLSPYEITRLHGVLRGADADTFVQAAARFALDGNKTALLRIESVLKPHDCAKWTVATYLPYLWLPNSHMFLKPEVTKDYATRVGHPLASIYKARLNFEVYQSLLDLADKTETAISDLAPRDRIDIQSFIWVVSKYPGDREGLEGTQA